MFRIPIHDVYCGMRGFTRQLYDRLDLRSPGMEFATEMIIRSGLQGATMSQVPITLYPDGRQQHGPHLRTFRDGWRTLRLFLVFSPRWTFLRPGMILIARLIAGDWGAFRDAFSHIVLPASLLGYFSLAYISRMTRSFMLEQLSAEYVTTARVKGVSETRVVWAHAFRNILIPLITVIALSFGGLLEGSVLTEIVFSWPGIGQYITKALLAGDMNAVLGGTVLVGACFVALNLLSDVLYRVLDPRAS